jgi:hypothetical protein
MSIIKYTLKSNLSLKNKLINNKGYINQSLDYSMGNGHMAFKYGALLKPQLYNAGHIVNHLKAYRSRCPVVQNKRSSPYISL